MGISGPVFLWRARLCALSVFPACLQEVGSDYLVGGEEVQGPWDRAALDHMQVYRAETLRSVTLPGTQALCFTVEFRGEGPSVEERQSLDIHIGHPLPFVVSVLPGSSGSERCAGPGP